jgi:hypothetical protein
VRADGGVTGTADVDAIVAAGPEYIVSADSYAISPPTSGTTFVGAHLLTTMTAPGRFWWTYRDGGPSFADLEAGLA